MDEKKESNSLMLISQIENENLETLDEETANFQTTIRVDKAGNDFLKNGMPIGSDPIVGVVIKFLPVWSRFTGENKPPDKNHGKTIPDGDGWKRRCEVTMVTKKHGVIVLDLSYTGFLNFGKYKRDLELYGKSFSDVFTRTVIGKGRSKKFGQYSSFNFEIAGLVGGGGAQKFTALPPAEEPPEEPPVQAMDIEEDEEDATQFDDTQPPDGDDVIPY